MCLRIGTFSCKPHRDAVYFSHLLLRSQPGHLSKRGHGGAPRKPGRVCSRSRPLCPRPPQQPHPDGAGASRISLHIFHMPITLPRFYPREQDSEIHGRPPTALFIVTHVLLMPGRGRCDAVVISELRVRQQRRDEPGWPGTVCRPQWSAEGGRLPPSGSFQRALHLLPRGDRDSSRLLTTHAWCHPVTRPGSPEAVLQIQLTARTVGRSTESSPHTHSEGRAQTCTPVTEPQVQAEQQVREEETLRQRRPGTESANSGPSPECPLGFSLHCVPRLRSALSTGYAPPAQCPTHSRRSGNALLLKNRFSY